MFITRFEFDVNSIFASYKNGMGIFNMPIIEKVYVYHGCEDLYTI